MRGDAYGNQDGPEVATLMAAVVRLMAQCSACCEPVKIRTLLRLLAELRAHPALPRQSAVLAGLAEAHAIWVDRLGQLSAAQAMAAAVDDDESPSRLH